MSWSFLLRSYVHPCRLEFGWLEGAATLFLNNEPQPARLILRDLVNAAVGFEELAKETAKPSKSLHLVFSVSVQSAHLLIALTAPHPLLFSAGDTHGNVSVST